MRFSGAAGALLAAAALAPASLSAPAGRTAAFVGEGVRDRLDLEGRARVVVSRDRAGAAPAGLQVVRSLSGGRLLAGFLTSAGLSGLAADGTTRSVVLDRVVRPAGQVGTAQIGADRLRTAGVTGLGRAIGVVDTGVDLYHPDLGASASGGGRVVGGWNFADDDADYNDCNGHGTAVAGVAAGKQGVAPEASIVALRVFGARDGCSSAYASDVLAAVEWALDRRDELRIDVLNLSLADDRSRSGFCDAEDPASAELFARARAEGVAVVAASGNAARANALAWPACFADVVSVGMVYSTGQGPTTWTGEAACTDVVTGPDVVPCASNGGAALSLLAPGVRWLAPAAGGGRRTTFSGTSAAAPAAAAALLLSRQVAPQPDPALSTEFLRLTGAPATDDRTGRATPRVDVGSAIVSPSPFSGPCERIAGFGAAPDGVACRAEVSALVGRVSSLAVALSVEDPKLSDLRADLTGPDGTTVRLVDGLATEGTVFREVIGRTRESDEPLSLLSGRPAAGTWTLRLEDGGGLAGGRVTSWALLVEPEPPRPVAPRAVPARLLPTVARNAGIRGAFWSTDAVLFNASDDAPADVKLTFLPAGATPAAGVSVEVPLAPRATRVLSDVVGNAFRTTGAGPIHVDAPWSVVVASRTATTIAGGATYGLLSCVVDSATAVEANGPSTWLAPVFRPGRTRVNVGVVEVAGEGAAVELLVRDGVGAVKGRFTLDVDPFGSRQLTDVHGLASIAASAEDLFEVRVLSGAGRVVAWAAAVDNGSNDGLLVTGSPAKRDAFLTAAAHAPGRFGAFFRTDLKLANPRLAPENVAISYFPSNGGEPRQVVVTLGAWETRVLEDVLSELFAVGDDGAGALRLTVLGSAPGIVASSRSYTEEGPLSYGLAIGALDDAGALPGERIALTFLSSTAETRTNVGFLETSGRSTLLRVSLLDTEGGRIATRELALAGLQAVQWNDVFAEMGAAPRANASAVVEVLSGGSVLAHAIRVDNRTNDAGFLPGRVLRSPSPSGSDGR